MNTHIASILPALELHTHNSIPSYTADLDEGCSTCIRNKAIDDCAEAIERANLVVCPDEDEIWDVIFQRNAELCLKTTQIDMLVKALLALLHENKI